MKQIFKINFLIMLLSGTVACNKVNFTPASLDAASSQVCTPGASDAQLNVPTIVQQNSPFEMQFTNRSSVTWKLTSGSTVVNYTGSDVMANLAVIGSYNGLVIGHDDCGVDDVREFQLQVVMGIQGLAVVINSNAIYTNNVNSQLTLSASGAQDMYVTNVVGCASGGSWESFATSKAWVLGDRNKNTKVYAKYRNTLGESPCVSDDITEDDMAPVASFVSTPAAMANSKVGNFQILVTDNLSGVKSISCQLDSNPAQVCQTSVSFSALSEGAHSLSVTALDNAGNVSTAISYAWAVDTTSPVVQLTKTPLASTELTGAEFDFVVTENGSGIASVQCSVDGKAAQACASPALYSGLAIGKHQFSVVATDKVGNSGSASFAWVVVDPSTNQDITVNQSSGKADVLMVVNNSQSMYGALTDSIPDRFSNFVKTLGSSDYRISVTTGSIAGGQLYENGGLARILYAPVPASGLELVPIQTMITPSMKDASDNMVATMMRPEVICTMVGTHLCPPDASAYQEGLHASLMTLQRSDTQYFFRPDAALDIVIVSDVDEGDGNLSHNGVIKPTTPAYNLPSTLINAVKTKWPNKEFHIHTVTLNPGASCNSQEIDGKEAPIYAQATQLTNGLNANICDEGDTKGVTAIANAIKSTVPKFQLLCQPLDTNGDGVPDITATYSPQPAVVSHIVQNGLSVSFQPTPPVGTVVHLNYHCQK